MALGENIYQLRTQKNMSQSDLADALEVSRQSVSKWENNSAVPELEKLIRMAELFDVSLDYLATGKDSAPTWQPKTGILAVAPRKIVGTALFFIAIASYLLLGTTIHSFEAGLAIGGPLVLCGVICFTFSKNTGVFCAWGLYLSFSILVPVLTNMTIPLEYYPEQILPTLMFIEIPMAAYTLIAFRRYPLNPSVRNIAAFILGCLLFLAYFALRCYRTMTFFKTGLYAYAVYLNPLHFALLVTLLLSALRFRVKG